MKGMEYILDIQQNMPNTFCVIKVYKQFNIEH